jgi:hypothetical protein
MQIVRKNVANEASACSLIPVRRFVNAPNGGRSRLTLHREYVKAVPGETDCLWFRQGDWGFPVQLILGGGAYEFADDRRAVMGE